MTSNCWIIVRTNLYLQSSFICFPFCYFQCPLCALKSMEEGEVESIDPNYDSSLFVSLIVFSWHFRESRKLATINKAVLNLERSWPLQSPSTKDGETRTSSPTMRLPVPGDGSKRQCHNAQLQESWAHSRRTMLRRCSAVIHVAS